MSESDRAGNLPLVNLRLTHEFKNNVATARCGANGRGRKHGRFPTTLRAARYCMPESNLAVGVSQRHVAEAARLRPERC